jgi:diguanylate cyclase (GGDEF)-like protein
VELSEYRKEFDIHFLAPRIAGFEKSIIQLKNLGHQVQWGETHAAFRMEFNANPSHLVVVHLLSLETSLEDFLIECLAASPKCLFIAVGLPSQNELIKSYFEYGVLAFVEMGESIADQVSWSIDLILERSIYQIQNEVLLAEKKDLKLKLKSSRENCELLVEELSDYKSKEIEISACSSLANDLLKTFKSAAGLQSKEMIIQNFLNSIDQIEGLEARGVFLKYLPQIQTLVATHCLGMEGEKIKSIGIRLIDDLDQSKKSISCLKENKSFTGLDDLITSAFSVSKYHINSVQNGEDTFEGVFVFWASDQNYFLKTEFECRFQAFSLILEKFNYQRESIEKSLEKPLEKPLEKSISRSVKIGVRDASIQIVGSAEFNELIKENILKSKNSLKSKENSVALVKFCLDQSNLIETEYGELVREAALKYIVALIKKTSRQNDILCRTALNEFSMILPFTDHREAMIRAEKLRRLLESTSMTSFAERLTLSLGISEYPSLTNRADQMVRGALQAMIAVDRLTRRDSTT